MPTHKSMAGVLELERLGDRQTLLRKLDQAVRAEPARRERWKRSLTEIAALPQLFIAA
jgi:hypothetical protein